ncbi:MAG: hypothetical protein K2F92_07600, partial [Alistipes sp.]|nr:hypothetical protein [Alistipes sp.]
MPNLSAGFCSRTAEAECAKGADARQWDSVRSKSIGVLFAGVGEGLEDDLPADAVGIALGDAYF